MSIWTVVGNGTAARVFASDGPAEFREIQTFTNPANRQHEGDLQSDRYGRSQHGGGQSESYEEPGMREHERDRFAAMVAEYLSGALHRAEFSHLYLVCSPDFLGVLRKHLPPAVLQVVKQEIPKNVVMHSNADIRAHLPQHL